MRQLPKRIHTPEWLDLTALAKRLAARRHSRPEVAEEIAQEALFRLILSLEKDLSEPTSRVRNPSAWLHVVIRNLSFRRRSRAALAQQAEAQFLDQFTGSGRVETERTVLAHETLAGLRREDRELLELHALGLKHREIADRLGYSTSSVGIRIQRARHRAIQLLARPSHGSSNE